MHRTDELQEQIPLARSDEFRTVQFIIDAVRAGERAILVTGRSQLSTRVPETALTWSARASTRTLRIAPPLPEPPELQEMIGAAFGVAGCRNLDPLAMAARLLFSDARLTLILAIDAAHTLSLRSLAYLSVMTELLAPDAPVLQIVLAADPALLGVLAQPEFENFQGRLCRPEFEASPIWNGGRAPASVRNNHRKPARSRPGTPTRRRLRRGAPGSLLDIRSSASSRSSAWPRSASAISRRRTSPSAPRLRPPRHASRSSNSNLPFRRNSWQSLTRLGSREGQAATDGAPALSAAVPARDGDATGPATPTEAEPAATHIQLSEEPPGAADKADSASAPTRVAPAPPSSAPDPSGDETWPAFVAKLSSAPGDSAESVAAGAAAAAAGAIVPTNRRYRAWPNTRSVVPEPDHRVGGWRANRESTRSRMRVRSQAPLSGRRSAPCSGPCWRRCSTAGTTPPASGGGWRRAGSPFASSSARHQAIADRLAFRRLVAMALNFSPRSGLARIRFWKSERRSTSSRL